MARADGVGRDDAGRWRSLLKEGGRGADSHRRVAKLRMSIVSYVLLGAVQAAGTATPYDLKRLVAARVGPFYDIAHSQYYDETARLAKAGLLEEQQEGEGRRRLLYQITADGRRELLRWLRVPDFARPELRDLGLLKLAFADSLDPDEVGNLARDQAELMAAMRAEVAEWAASDPSPPTALSLAVADALVVFWEQLAASLPDRASFEPPE